MFTFEYRFYPIHFNDEFDEDMYWFLASLSKNGLILEDFQNTVKQPDHYACRLIAPTKDSLNEKFYNKYNHKFLNELIGKSARAPEFEFIAENYDVPDSCVCEKSSHFILHTSYNSSVSPIICGDCLDPVPLFDFPKTYDDSEYYDILNWKKVYKACDMQFMQGIGERHGYKMIHCHDSALTQEGLRICTYLEDRVSKKFYYFLYDYYEKNKRTCPKCGSDWVNLQSDVFNYNYVCHQCRLVSN
jgi:Zn-ribbon-containing, possibly nucleic-acid-binding protein